MLKRIKELREKNNLTQSELARLLNITRSSVNAWEMGISIPSTEKIVELALILHTTSDYILGINNDEILPIYKYSLEEKDGVTIDETRFILRMNDTNKVYVNTINLKRLNGKNKLTCQKKGGNI